MPKRRAAAVQKLRAAKPPDNCKDCGEPKQWRYPEGTNLQTWCEPCRKLRARLRRVGLSREEYDRLMAEQQGLCACCEEEPATALDHCHISGRFRGILCNRCNLLIGWLETMSEGGFQKVLDYLEKANARPVL